MADFNFTQHATAEPSGANVHIDPEANYGYWEYRDGTEGGGLWFAPTPGGRVELIDYDGAFELPSGTVAAIRSMGYEVDGSFEPWP